MQIRKATKNDDPYTILQLLYNTDAYIYPILMEGNLQNYAHLLTEHGMYHYDNITIATVDGNIAGLTLAFTNDVIINKMNNNTIEKYYIHLKESLDNQSLYINNVSVFEYYRGMGIATKLIQFVEKHTSMQKLVLDCLEENTNTVRLYEKLGFSITATSPAFCVDASKNIMDVRMEKIVR